PANITLSLHDSLPTSEWYPHCAIKREHWATRSLYSHRCFHDPGKRGSSYFEYLQVGRDALHGARDLGRDRPARWRSAGLSRLPRSEEHTSELQSPDHL